MDPDRRYWARVDLLDGEGRPLPPAGLATFGTGAGRKWRADAIWAPAGVGGGSEPPDWAFMRGAFHLPDRPILWATLSVTASSTAPSRQYVYSLWLNGSHLGCGPVFPLGDEARYDAYDVTGLLEPGSVNALGVLAHTGRDKRFAAALTVCLRGGGLLHFGSGSLWKALDGSAAFPQAGSIGTAYYQAPVEDIQAAAFPAGLSAASFDDSSWPAASLRTPFEDLHASPVDPLRPAAVTPCRIMTRGRDHVILDFGRALLGGISLDLTLAAPADLEIRFGEVLDGDGGVRYHLAAGNVYLDRWQLAAGRNRLQTWGMRAFRYVELIPSQGFGTPIGPGRHPEGGRRPAAGGRGEALRDLAAAVRGITLRPAVNDPAAAFSSSEPVLDRVWELCRQTAQGLGANIYVDSWTRERAPYEADAWIQQEAHLALDDAPSLGAYTARYLAAHRTWPTEWPLYTILMVHDTWMQTGSPGLVRSLYPALVGLLPEKYVDPRTGLVVKDPGLASRKDGDLVDWPPCERDGFVFGRVNTVVNALASQAYADMADLASAVGRRDQSSLWASRARAIRRSIDGLLFDPATGSLCDGLDAVAQGGLISHHSLHASAFALAFADLPEDHLEAVGSYLRGRGMACSVYAAAVYLGGLYRAGMGADADALMARREGIRTWAHMVDQAGGGTMEAWDPAVKPNTTYSHPWGASPASLLPGGLMGLVPLRPGFPAFACIPQPGSIRSARSVMPVRAGRIEAAYQVLGGSDLPDPVGGRTPVLPGIEVDLAVPARTRATLVLPPLAGLAPATLWEVRVDGVTRLIRSEAGFFRLGGVRCPPGSLVVEGLGPGRHRVRSMGAALPRAACPSRHHHV